MSKPTPGLGKGIARTIAHSVPTTSSSVIHHPISAAPLVSTQQRFHSSLPRAVNPLALLPLWDAPAATSTASSLSVSAAAAAVAAAPALGVASGGVSSRRSYVSASAPLRAAVEAIPHYLPSSLLFDASPRSSFNDFSFPQPTKAQFNADSGFQFPTPPPSPPVLRVPSPPQHAKQPRPTETHTVLSPTLQLSNSPSPSPTPPLSYLGIRPDGVDFHDGKGIPDPDNMVHSSSNLVFHLGAAGQAKERPPTPPSRSGRTPPPPRPRSFPLPDVSPPSALQSTAVGEDSYFTRIDGLCVADGVGGWSASGKGPADAGRWSRLLTHYCEEEVGRWWAGAEEYMTSGGDDVSGWAARAWKRGSDAGAANGVERKHRRPLDPVEIMQKGYEKCLACAAIEGIYGSSTCLLALLYHSTLLVANLGDCSLLLIRRGEVVFRTAEMQHAFNFPLQLGTHSRDEPMKDAKRYDIGVEKEDVVIVASDGLMDNLFEVDILETLSEFAPPSQPDGKLPDFSPQLVSEALCERALAVSEQTTATTPFMVRAIDEGIDFVGGKRDDISVLVGVIGDREQGGVNLTLEAGGAI